MRSNTHSQNALQIIQLISQFTAEQQRACFVVLTVLLTRSEPVWWEGMPAEVRKDYQKLWEKYANEYHSR